MKLNERILWDTTEYPAEYPKKIKKIYFRVSLINRRPFTKWIGSISKSFRNDIDWWVTLPATRDPYVSSLFHSICILKTLEILKSQIKNILIKVNSKSLFNIIENWSKKNNLSINIEYINNSKKLNGFFIIPKTIFFYFFLFFFLKFLTKKNIIKKNINKNVLIDTFATKESIQGERLYQRLDIILKKKKAKHVFFVPTFVIERNLLNVVKIIQCLSRRNYLFKEHYLSFSDIFFSSLHFLRIKKFIKKYDSYFKWDLSQVICDEIRSSQHYPSKVNAILNYRFAKNLSIQKVPIKKTINWFENQIVDKGWNLGFRKFFKNIKTYGYQGFISFPHYMNSIPSKQEEYAKVIPSEIIIMGKAYKNLKKEFFPKLKVTVGPALNYTNIFKINSKSNKIKVLVILPGIQPLDSKLLEWICAIEENNKNLKVIIKPHPVHSLPFLPNLLDKINFKNRKNLFISNEKLSNLLEKTSIVICSGPTGAIMESLAYNCFLLVPVLDSIDEFFFKATEIPKSKYCLVYNKIELSKIIAKKINKKYVLKNKKNNNLKFKKLFFEKISNKNLKYYY